ncbi:ATP-binding protein [Planotetraspora sp. A-T 1434]|uniref:ATP-binding protein n=1 Tax=Planotetraspora sp. A-T 1434 TaxID=2979219 RepID=UPI0021BEFD9A|nr:ATP-binding protein [Planotetraspora sp. A-T 1434]MCT9932403.1 ATP-binding protein [Planotetraspora sp. A-T 1434]
MTLKTRKPTGAVPWPLILLEGGEKAGKSWACAELSASDKVGQTYWLDLSEGAADEYGAIPGARYLVIEHDGTWADIMASVVAVRDEARRAADAGEPPVVLVIDSMTAEWDMLKDWAANRAKGSQTNQKRLRQDPHAEIQVPMNLWNDATARHRRLMTVLMTFPGVVVMTARGKDVASLDSNGRPVEGSKDYKVEGHKNLCFDASVWVRMSRDHAPLVVGARSVHAGLRPGVDKPQPIHDFSLERLVFDLLKCDPTTARVRDLTPMKPGDEPDTELSPKAAELLQQAEDAATVTDLGKVWSAIGPALKADEITRPEADRVANRVNQLKAEMGQDKGAAA